MVIRRAALLLAAVALVSCARKTDAIVEPPADLVRAPPVILDTKAIATKAHGFLRRDKYARAVQLLEQIVAQRPGDARHQLELGWAAFLAGDPDRARSALAAAIAAAPGDPALLAAAQEDLGRIAEAADDVDGARQAYAASLAARPGSRAVAAHLAHLNATVLLPQPCDGARSAAELCSCLGEVVFTSPDNLASGPRGEATCKQVGRTVGALEVLRVVVVAGDAEGLVLVRRVGGRLATVGLLGVVASNPRVTGILELDAFGPVSLGGVKAVAATVLRRLDQAPAAERDDWIFDEDMTTTRDRLTAYVRPAGRRAIGVVTEHVASDNGKLSQWQVEATPGTGGVTTTIKDGMPPRRVLGTFALPK
jgi:hypothetical protein